MKIFGFPFSDEADDATGGVSGGADEGAAAAVSDSAPPEDPRAAARERFAEFERRAEERGDDHSAPDDEGVTDGHPGIASGAAGSQTQAPTFDADLLDRAAFFGLGPERFEGMSADEVRERLDLMAEVFVSGQAAGDEPTRQDRQPAQQPAAQQTQRQEPPAQPGPFLTKFTPEQLEDLGPEFKTFVESVDAEVSSLREQVRELTAIREHFDRQESQRISTAFDEIVGGLGPEWPEIYGGDPAKLTPAQAKARHDLFGKVVAFGGVEALTNKAVIANFARGMNAEHFAKSVKRSVSDAVRRQGANRLRPIAPTSVRPALETGDDPEEIRRARARETFRKFEERNA
jgi:hypothetical protein